MAELNFATLKFDDICDALQQNRERVALAYFEIWTIKIIEVGMGGNNSPVDFEIFIFYVP